MHHVRINGIQILQDSNGRIKYEIEKKHAASILAKLVEEERYENI